MTKKTHDLCVVVDTYQKDGQTKNKYLNIGAVMVSENNGETNKYILLDRTFNPAGVKNPDNRSNLLVSVFPFVPQQNTGNNSASNNSSSFNVNDNSKPSNNTYRGAEGEPDIPF